MPGGDALQRDEIPPGTLDMLILRTLARGGEMHGYEIASFIKKLSDDVLRVEEGSLYPALQRMLVKGWVTAEWGTTEGNRRARYYQLTAAGRKQLEAEVTQFERVVAAIGRVIQTA
jgi:transcriptional regulator